MPIKFHLSRFKTAPINYKSKGVKLSKNEDHFLKDLHRSLDNAVNNHLNYCVVFFAENNLRFGDKPAKIALEISALYCYYVLKLIGNSNREFKTPFTQICFATFLDSSFISDKELEELGMGGLNDFYKKRSLDLVYAQFTLGEDSLNLNNEMNHRKMLITDPLCDINYVQYTVPDNNKERAQRNLDHFFNLHKTAYNDIKGIAEKWLGWS